MYIPGPSYATPVRISNYTSVLWLQPVISSFRTFVLPNYISLCTRYVYNPANSNSETYGGTAFVNLTLAGGQNTYMLNVTETTDTIGLTNYQSLFGGYP